MTRRMLDGKLVLLFGGAPPNAGYAVDVNDNTLWRNGAAVGRVLSLKYDRDALGWWIEYVATAGGPLDR